MDFDSIDKGSMPLPPAKIKSRGELMVIYQGDQYSIPFVIKRKGEKVTPDTVSDVVIAIGDIVRAYSEGTLTYSTADEVWLFPIYREETLKLPIDTSYQIEIHIGKDVIHSKEYPIKLKTILDSLKERAYSD